MDPIRQPEQTGLPDADINVLVYKTGKFVKKIIDAIWRCITGFFSSIFLLLLFILRNIIWIIAGTVVGLGYGLYVLNKNGVVFQSEMIVKTNFNSSRPLYKTVDYLNAVINTGAINQLDSIFDITTEEARQINGFSVQPVESKMAAAEMYRDMFLQNYNPWKNDTVLRRSFTYSDFKNTLTQFDYPLQEITVRSTNPFLFSKLQNGILQLLTEIPVLREARNSQVAIDADAEKTIKNAIANLDSLNHAYVERIAKGQPSSPSESNQLTILQNLTQQKTPETDAYDKLIGMNEYLKQTKIRSVSERNILEVYSPLSPVGHKVSFFQQSVVKFSMYGLIISTAVLLIIGLRRLLGKQGKKPQIA